MLVIGFKWMIMNCCVNVVSASFQQFPVNNCNNKLLRRPAGKSQIHRNFANNSIVNKYYNGIILQRPFDYFAQRDRVTKVALNRHHITKGNNCHMTERTHFLRYVLV